MKSFEQFQEQSHGEEVDGKFMSYATMKAKGIKPKQTAAQKVRKDIEDRHGKGAIYDSERDKPSEEDRKSATAERNKRQAEKNKAFADRAKKAGYKSTQDYANVVARYGGEDNMRKGKGLGT